MVKLIGILLILSSIVALAAGIFVDWNYGTSAEVTGNVIFSIMTQPSVPISLFDYIAGIAFSYSILSFIMGIVFLFKV